MDKWTLLTLSGRVDEKERRTVVEWISGWPFMGTLLTAMTFRLESAARISSSLSTTGTSKITPLLMEEEEEGREQVKFLSASWEAERRICCWSIEFGKTQRSPPNIKLEWATSLTRALRARWKASRSAVFIFLKLGELTEIKIMTGGIGGVLGGGEREPRTGKSDADFTKDLLFGGLDPKEKTWFISGGVSWGERVTMDLAFEIIEERRWNCAPDCWR